MSSRLLVLAAALLFSTGGAVIKAISLTSWQVASLRSLVAAIILLLILPESRRGWTVRTLMAAVAYAATLVTFAVATKLTTSANAIFLQSTAPIYLIVISPLFLHEKLRRSDLLQGAIVAAGMALFFLDPAAASHTAPEPGRGNLYAAASGLSWAITVAALRGAAKSGSGSLAAVASGNLIACFAALPAAWPFQAPTQLDWALLLYLGAVQIGLAYWCLARGIREVPAFTAAMLLLLEPAINPIWTWLLHSETPSLYAIVGGAIILGATLLGQSGNKGR